VKPRDDFSAATKRILASRVGWLCSRPECGAATSGPTNDPSRAVNVGVAAHIQAAAPGGPRFDSGMTPEQRQSVENGIWLCQTCAKLIDSDVDAFPVAVLRAWKIAAERAAAIRVGKTSPSTSEDYYDVLKKLAPESTADFFFREGFEALRAAAPDLIHEVSVEEGGVTVTTHGKHGEPISVAFDPVFPDTPLGRRKAEEFARHLAGGTPVELDETNVPVDVLPEPLRSTLRARNGGPFTLRLGPRRPRRFANAVIFRATDGESYELPYVEFGSNRFEDDDVVLTNEQQRLPVHLSLRLRRDRSAEFQYTVTLAEKGFHWLRDAIRIQRILSKDAIVLLRDLDDGTEHPATHVQFSAAPIANDEALLEIAERVIAIQRRLNIPLVMPQRSVGTREDREALKFIETVITTGLQPRPPANVAILVDSIEKLEFVRGLGAGDIPLGVSTPMHIEQLFDNPVPLGPIEVTCERVVVEPADMSKLEALVAASVSEFPQQIRVKAAEGAEMSVRYLAWLSKTDT
jgi:hypothetical protein